MKTLTLLGLALLFSAVTAWADSITETFSFAPTATPFTISSSAISQFNPSMGTLTSIQVVFSGTAAGTATISNGSSASGTYDFSVQTTLDLLNPASTPLISEAPVFTGSLVVPSGDTVTSGALLSPSDTDSLVLSSGFGPYTGTGSYDLALIATAAFGPVTGPSPFTISESTSATASGVVIYNFASAVPEPSALLLLGSGVGLLGLALRRRPC